MWSVEAVGQRSSKEEIESDRPVLRRLRRDQDASVNGEDDIFILEGERMRNDLALNTALHAGLGDVIPRLVGGICKFAVWLYDEDFKLLDISGSCDDRAFLAEIGALKQTLGRRCWTGLDLV
ncbi:MAG: hypothetical protein H6643_09005 [Caldilineaceae bacterium]|nr:hypothetical protein [Caldilineaceae bacterium]